MSSPSIDAIHVITLHRCHTCHRLLIDIYGIYGIYGAYGIYGDIRDDGAAEAANVQRSICADRQRPLLIAPSAYSIKSIRSRVGG